MVFLALILKLFHILYFQISYMEIRKFYSFYLFILNRLLNLGFPGLYGNMNKQYEFKDQVFLIIFVIINPNIIEKILMRIIMDFFIY